MQEKNKLQFNIIDRPLDFQIIKRNNIKDLSYYSCFINVYKNYWISFDNLPEPSLDNLVCIKDPINYNEYIDKEDNIYKMIEIAQPYIKKLIFNDQLQEIINEK